MLLVVVVVAALYDWFCCWCCWCLHLELVQGGCWLGLVVNLLLRVQWLRSLLLCSWLAAAAALWAGGGRQHSCGQGLPVGTPLGQLLWIALPK